MLATHAPPSLINPLQLFRSHSLFSRTISPFSATRSLFVRTVASMAGVNSSPDHVVGTWYSVPELRLRNHRFVVPLDYSLEPRSSPKISVFAREVVAVGKEDQLLPYLLFLQGGPGFECPRPTEASGWIHKACEEFHLILMDQAWFLDACSKKLLLIFDIRIYIYISFYPTAEIFLQRGTGLSTPLMASSMSQFKSAEDLVDYLKHFRADNIVNDAEFMRVRLVPDAGPWTILGQSYGGFCAVTYLSFAPQGLRQVLLTGGTPPIGNGCTADTVYRVCSEQIILQNEKYYKRYPQDIEIVREVVNYLTASEGGGVLLPSGGILTPRGLQTLGLSCLGTSAGFERLHYMFEGVWDPVLVPGSPKQISYYFLNAFERSIAFDTNPLYALLHESIYCQMIFPWMFDEIHALTKFKDAAHILAEKQDWPPLYDTNMLNNNKVPVAAAVYYDDLFVNFKIAMETASQIAGIRLWITNEYMHSGLRDRGGKVFEHLMGMLNGKKPLF
ncbi:proline iminopeptidase [Quercus suber]|uniref:Proline iminopeptidase n=1 Tax=Quercus suber TaxID=58331 RepID=A0AAW0LZU6_QUESU